MSLFQMYVIPGGVISMATVTSRVKPVQTGQMHYKNATETIQSLLMSIPMKKMSTYNIAIMEINPGWV